MKKYNFGPRTKIIALIGSLIILLALFNQLLKSVNGFFDKNYLAFNRVVEIKVNSPFEVRKREIKVEEIIKVINEQPLPENLTPIESYICNKWGLLDCRLALAIAQAESGMKEDAIGFNRSSIDYGIFQINSVHWSKPGCALKDLVDPYKNVDCAYEIFKTSGWSPWTTWKNGSFRAYVP